MEPVREPFRFYTRLTLTELTGLKAANLAELAAHLETVPDSSIYHHTHRFLQQHQHLSPEPPNDFAFWAGGILGEEALAERLASIDTVEYGSIAELRREIAAVIAGHLRQRPSAGRRFADPGEEFHFLKSVSFIAPTGQEARDLREFAALIRQITLDSLYFHVFEARLRLGKKTNDFSLWLADSLGLTRLARALARLDPYTRTLEDLRQTIAALAEKELGAHGPA